MGDNTNIKFPAWLLVLDVVGTLLLALGLYGQFGDDNPFRQAALALIVTGALLMLPLVVFVITRLTNRR